MSNISEATTIRGLIEANRKRVFTDTNKKPAGFYGISHAVQVAREKATRFIDGDKPLLIRGNSRTGKNQLLEFVCSEMGLPLEIRNFAGMPVTLLESEVFGHTAGAYTGANKDRKGLLKVVGEGVLCLDELGEIDSLTQAKLLRVIDKRMYTPVGEDKEIKIKARFVVTTSKHEHLEEQILTRMKGTVKMPALHERMVDIFFMLDGILYQQRMNDRPTWNLDNQQVAEGGILYDGFTLMRMLSSEWPRNSEEVVHWLDESIRNRNGIWAESEAIHVPFWYEQHDLYDDPIQIPADSLFLNRWKWFVDKLVQTPEGKAIFDQLSQQDYAPLLTLEALCEIALVVLHNRYELGVGELLTVSSGKSIESMSLSLNRRISMGFLLMQKLLDLDRPVSIPKPPVVVDVDKEINSWTHARSEESIALFWLNRTNWNKAAAARGMDIKEKKLRGIIDRYKLTDPSKPDTEPEPDTK